METVEERRGLEWSHVYLYDDGASEDTTNDFDPTAQVVYSTESTLIVRGLPEAEGDVILTIAVDETPDLGLTPVLLAVGRFVAPSGRLIARTSSWDESIRLPAPPGDYDFRVHADDDTWPQRLTILLSGQPPDR